MNILVASDKFKHSLSSLEACRAIESGLSKRSEKFNIQILPMADGGDGLSEIIEYYTSSKIHALRVSDPLFRMIDSSLLISKSGKTAFIEMAKASGLQLLRPEEYNCMYTSSFGTGELIKEAIRLQAKNIIIGIGGSATNDCGIGMAAALGYCFLDKNGFELQPTGKNLQFIAHIDSTKCIDFKHTKFTVACDVKNLLTGQNGATRVYAAQKGASPEDIHELENGMQHFARIIKKELGKDLSSVEGAGAAGGLGAGCMAFLDADLTSGIEMILEISEAEKYIREADLIITGEGRLDAQSLSGKVLSGIGPLCKKYNKPLIAFCGEITISPEQLDSIHVSRGYVINVDKLSREEGFRQAGNLLAETVFWFENEFIR
ncbi:MAG: glycerate kinase [Pyrinomonadaceae bacterium]|nr:glycerate kinase [Sphingobacteriaceae bacterium]